MTIVARRIIATPARSASEAWQVITDLIAPELGSARSELMNISGIVSSLISDETLKSDSAVIYGEGPRLKIYCLYNEEAISGDNASESKLGFVPTDGDWQMSLPCNSEDIEWITDALSKKTTRVKVREIGTAVEDNSDDSKNSSRDLEVDLEEFLKL